jgi:hypothetical protein
LKNPSPKKKKKKKKKDRAGGVAQGESHEFKPQYHKDKKTLKFST